MRFKCPECSKDFPEGVITWGFRGPCPACKKWVDEWIEIDELTGAPKKTQEVAGKRPPLNGESQGGLRNVQLVESDGTEDQAKWYLAIWTLPLPLISVLWLGLLIWFNKYAGAFYHYRPDDPASNQAAQRFFVGAIPLFLFGLWSWVAWEKDRLAKKKRTSDSKANKDRGTPTAHQ